MAKDTVIELFLLFVLLFFYISFTLIFDLFLCTVSQNLIRLPFVNKLELS